MTTAPTLRVYPNPFAALDHEGLPVGVYPFDPDHAGGSRRWVGAIIDKSAAADGKPKTRAIARSWDKGTAVTVRTKKGQTITRRAFSAPDVRIYWAHDLSPQTLPVTPHYIAGIRSGGVMAGILPADAATASIAGIPFVPPAKALLAAATAAIAAWTGDHGSPPPTADWAPALRHAAGLDTPTSSDVASVLATIPTLAKAATADTFTLATWSPTDPTAVALYAAVVAALHAAGLKHVTEQADTVAGTVTSKAIVLSVTDLHTVAAAAATPTTTTAPAWLLSLAPTQQAGAASAGGAQ